MGHRKRMTGKDRIRSEIACCRRFHKPGAVLTLVSFSLMPFIAIMALPCFIGFSMWAGSIIGLLVKLKCPNCKHRLSYLVTDPGYSKTSIVFVYPKDIPDNIDACPYCHWDFSSEVSEARTEPDAPAYGGDVGGSER